MDKQFKAGVIQFDVKKGQIETNLTEIFKYLETLVSEGVSLAVLPEMFSCSFDNENLEQHSQVSNTLVQQLMSFAREKRIAIAGTLPDIENKKIYNTMKFIDVDGRVKGNYRKLHLFRLTGEHLYYTAGNEIVTADTSFGTIGLMTCYDLRFPELARALWKRGARLILVSAQWPEPRKVHWKTLIQARAVENQLFMVCSNRTGVEDGLRFPGMSMIVDPMGNILAESGPESGCYSALIDPAKVAEFRAQIPCKEDLRKEIYG